MATKSKRRTKRTLKAPKAAHQVRICFERIIPDAVDAERPLRHALRQTLMANAARPTAAMSVHFARMAVQISKKWSPGSTVRCRFLDGTKLMRRKVEAIAHQWENYANIKLVFVDAAPEEIRISFHADSGSWSAVGRDALNDRYFPKHQATMNYGWLRDNTDDEEYSRVVLHEFGHALGCIHEHESPKFKRIWNVPNVMKYFSGPPNNWSPDEIRSNVLDKYPSKGISATEYDPKSIMLYEFDAILFADGKGPTNTNTKLSTKDERKIKQMYPE